MSGIDLSTKAGVLRFAELRRAEMVGCFERLGRFEVNGFAFCAYVFATHAVKVPSDHHDLDGWKTGPRLPRVNAERVRMPAALHGIIPETQETALFSTALRQYTKLTRAIGTLVMCEMWWAQGSREDRAAMPPRLADYEGRREVLYVNLEHSATGRRTWRAEIERQPTRLAPWAELEQFDAEGRLVDLAEWRS